MDKINNRPLSKPILVDIKIADLIEKVGCSGKLYCKYFIFRMWKIGFERGLMKKNLVNWKKSVNFVFIDKWHKRK